jgi:hypothetical protein
MSPMPARRRVLAIVGLGVLVVAAALMLLSPRHREFYFGTARRASTPVKQVATDVASGVASGVRIAMTGPPAEIKPVAISTRGRTLAMDPDGRLRVPITTEAPLPRLPADGVPKGWELREFTGRADVQMIRAPQGLAVLLKADRTSFALYRDVIVDLDVLPRLSWTWRVTKLPLRGDVRQKASDDQAAQVYVIFPRWPSPRATSDVIGYVWDSTAPVGTTIVSPHASNVRVVVVESGPGQLNSWQRQERDVAADFAGLFGRRPSRVGGVAVMIDANDTASTAEAAIGHLTFSRTPS